MIELRRVTKGRKYDPCTLTDLLIPDKDLFHGITGISGASAEFITE